MKAAKLKAKVPSVFKRRTIYIILTVVFSLLLLLDLALALLVPSGNRMGGMDISSFDSAGMTLPGSAAGEFSDSNGGPAADSDDSSNTDSGEAARSDGSDSGDVELPDGADFDTPDFDASDFDGGDVQLPGSADADSALTGQSATSSTSFLQRLRAAWLPIFIVLLLLDGGSVFMLIFLSRREKKSRERLELEQLSADGQPHLIPRQKKKSSPKTAWILPAVLLVLLVVVVRAVTAMNSSEEAAATEATVYSATAETGDLSVTVPGAGTLTDQDAVSLSVPSEVEITAWYVSNGDEVEQGDLLAAVDLSSVLSAIATVQSTINELDEALAEAAEDEIDDAVTAAADGRVKLIYAREGTAVADTMYESGALMLLSLDGMMQVEVETDGSLSVGNSVTVTLSDGTEETGKVESVTGGVAVITLTDDGPEVGETVTVTAGDGTELGSGTLSVHSALLVTGYTGTVESVAVSEEEEVSAGDTLLTLTDTEDAALYESLLLQRTELEEQLQQLFELYQTGGISAPCAGIVSGIDDDSSDSSDTTTATASSTASTSSGGYTLALLTTTSSGTDVQEQQSDNSGANAQAQQIGQSYPAIVLAVEDGVLYLDYNPASTGLTDFADLSGVDFSILNMTERLTLETSALSATLICAYADGQWSYGTADGLSAGDLVLVCYGEDADPFQDAPLWIVCQSLRTADTDSTDASDNTDSANSTDALNSVQQTQEDDTSSQTEQQTQSEAADTAAEEQAVQSETQTQTDAETADAAAETSGGDTGGEDASAQTVQSSSYAVSEQTLLSITPQDTMDITITVDELDILLLEVGQTAQVTLDAIAGQSFEGAVTSIDLTGTSSEGNTKYTAVITIDRGEDMLSGMNASVLITLETREDVLTMPAEALYEDGSATYVYTTCNEKTGELGGLVEVTTGLSDGLMVEITSGLSEGDAYYYSCLDTVNYSVQSVQGSTGSFSFSSMFGSSMR
ncbi:MAG: HlyD family efflux transporter periplasmic adaptor subunit [Oscillospiraceae bacterium]|nr:HlyD family efflux transporter periplasmic adaptor subunit [Oscillospiraceae bacterium]